MSGTGAHGRRLAALVGAVVARFALPPARPAALVEAPPPARAGGAPPAETRVVETTLRYAEAPRATRALEIHLANGQRLLWDADLCRLAGWLDADGTALLLPSTARERWPGPDLQVMTGYHQLTHNLFGGSWESFASDPSRPRYVGHATADDAVTLTCHLPNLDEFGGSERHVATRVTFRPESRTFGTAYRGFSIAIDLDAAGLLPRHPSQVHWGIGALAVDGDAAGLDGWYFEGIFEQLKQTRFYPGDHIRHGSGGQPFTMLTHPRGTYLLYVPAIGEEAGSPVLDSRGTEPRVSAGQAYLSPRPGSSSFATPPLAVLFSSEDAGLPIPQRFLNARFGIVREQARSLGLGIHHFRPPYDGVNAGEVEWRRATIERDFAPPHGVMAWYQRRVRLIGHTDLFGGRVPGDNATIDGTLSLHPDLYLPAASDLPGLQPPATAERFTLGTLQDLRNMLDRWRLLGIQADIWTREYYSACVESARESTQWSRFDNSWPCSIFWRDHPHWGPENANGSLVAAPQAFPNLANPDYLAWRKDWTKRWWLDNGIIGIFRDTGGLPEGGYHYYQGVLQDARPFDWDYYKFILMHGGYFIPEGPLTFMLSEASGAPWAARHREWGASLAFVGFSPRTCWAVSPDCPSAVLDYSDAQYDLAVARRYHSIVAGVTWGGSPQVDDAAASGLTEQIKAEMKLYGERLDRWGIPDRVELIAPRRVAWPVRLARDVTPDSEAMQANNGPQMAHTGRLQIDNEIVLYRELKPTGPGGGTLQQLVRGYENTARAPHRAGATVVNLDDQMHWDWEDTYWVYGSGDAEVWVRYSDGSVWRRGGQEPAHPPTISDVSVTASCQQATLRWRTDVESIGWVEYDTFGTQEQYAGHRPEGWWPAYRYKSHLDQADLPRGEFHETTIGPLIPGARYHFRVVARGPAPGVTPDTMFTAAC